MAIRIDRDALAAELDRAARVAAGSEPVPQLWTQRTEWLGQFAREAAGKTYIAALGGALLAKATDPRVDSLTQSGSAGPNAYSLRSVTEFLQERIRGRAHLGTLSRWPLNNRPFLGGPPRIDRFVTVSGVTREAFDEFVHWLQELNSYDQGGAHLALAAFLRVRMTVQQQVDAEVAASPRMGAARSLADLLDALHVFVTEDPEGGSRGQAVVAAVLDCVHPDVEVVPANHPAPFDVKRRGTPPPLVVEVKQQPIMDGDILELARRAAEVDATVAVYAALDPQQPPLPVDRLRADALERFGVLLDVCTTVAELAAQVAVHAGRTASEIAESLPQHAMERVTESGVSSEGRNRLTALLEGVASA